MQAHPASAGAAAALCAPAAPDGVGGGEGRNGGGGGARKLGARRGWRGNLAAPCRQPGAAKGALGAGATQKSARGGAGRVAIQVLQYEFLGPAGLSEWGPPMEKVVYLVMGRDRDRFKVLYAGECERTDRADYLTSNDRFGCWLREGGGEANLHLAILPMFEAGAHDRKRVVDRIVSAYAPACNGAAAADQ